MISSCNSRQSSNKAASSDSIKHRTYTNNPSVCEDTCFGDFDRFGTKRIGNTLNVYISGYNADIMIDCCRFTFGEIVYNYTPDDTTIEIVKMHLLDLKAFEIPKDSSLYGNDEIKRKVMCISINDKNSPDIRIIADPYNIGIYKKPKEWDK